MRRQTSMRGAILLTVAVLVGADKFKYEDVTVGGCGGPGAYADYSTMLSALAAAGYVVIVSKSSNWPFECASEWKDQLRSMAWAKTSKFARHIDFALQTGVLGHSMGGGASYHCAGLPDAVKGYNIGAAIALHPQIRSPLHLQPFTNSLVPIFFGAGSSDGVVSPESVKTAYAKTEGVSKVFAEIKGAFHDEPMSKPWGKARYTPYVIAMFDCHLKGNKRQCRQIYGKGAGTLCAGDVKMTECEYVDRPLLDDVVV